MTIEVSPILLEKPKDLKYMRCKICGSEIPNNSLYCPICGTATITDKQSRSVKKRTLIRILIVVAAIALFCVGMFFGIVHSSKSKKASGTDTEQLNGSIDSYTASGDTVTSNEEVIQQPMSTNSIDSIEKSDDLSVSDSNSYIDTAQGNTDGDSVKAKELTVEYVENVLSQIDEAMSSYIGVVIMTMAQDGFNRTAGESLDVNLADREKIRASVLTSKPDGVIDSVFREVNGRIVMDRDAETGPVGDGFHGLSVPTQLVDQNCRDLFGTEANWTELQSTVRCNVYDAAQYSDKTGTYALILDKEVETETDQESHEYRVTENIDSYTGEVELFWGYRRKLLENPNFSNYRVTYELIPDNNSKYKLVISSINIKKIADDAERSNAPQNNEPVKESYTNNDISHAEPFYGVWCYASKDRDEAQLKADELTALGFEGQVYISSDWSNLNPERWYCTSAGASSTMSEAESVLDLVQKAGYSDAYIKYSGYFLQ